jgi:Protein of unknown function (DUF1488)
MSCSAFVRANSSISSPPSGESCESPLLGHSVVLGSPMELHRIRPLAPNGPGGRPNRRLLIGAILTSTYRRGTMTSVRNGSFAMPLQRGEVQGYDFNRMIVEFTMLNQGKVILCAISTAAMDDLEGRRDVRPDQRVDQFMRLREVFACSRCLRARACRRVRTRLDRRNLHSRKSQSRLRRVSLSGRLVKGLTRPIPMPIANPMATWITEVCGRLRR